MPTGKYKEIKLSLYFVHILQFNKLRFEVSQTGRGKISKRLALTETEGIGLDYLREEAVKGQ